MRRWPPMRYAVYGVWSIAYRIDSPCIQACIAPFSEGVGWLEMLGVALLIMGLLQGSIHTTHRTCPWNECRRMRLNPATEHGGLIRSLCFFSSGQTPRIHIKAAYPEHHHGQTTVLKFVYGRVMSEESCGAVRPEQSVVIMIPRYSSAF